MSNEDDELLESACGQYRAVIVGNARVHWSFVLLRRSPDGESWGRYLGDFPGRATREEARDRAIALLKAFGPKQDEGASGEDGPSEEEEKPAVRREKVGWPEYMRRRHEFLKFREAAYHLQDERLDWPEFIKAVRAAYPDRELDPRSEPLMRKIWERKSFPPPEQSKEQFPGIRDPSVHHGKRRVWKPPRKGPYSIRRIPGIRQSETVSRSSTGQPDSQPAGAPPRPRRKRTPRRMESINEP